MVNWFKDSVLPLLASWGIRLLGKTMTWTIVGGEGVDAFVRKEEPIIIAFWHGRQLMMPMAYRGTSASILISQHRDGGMIANIMKQFGFCAIRGSSSRRGSQALRELVSVGRQGQDLVVTPDGPRGPACHVQMGVISLAKITGFPIVPLTFACAKKKVFSSWDRFQVPYPWTKGMFVWGDPIWVGPHLRKEDLVERGVELQRVLNTLTEYADVAVQQSDPLASFLLSLSRNFPSIHE